MLHTGFLRLVRVILALNFCALSQRMTREAQPTTHNASAVTAAPALRTVTHSNRRKNDTRASQSVPCAQSKMCWLKR
jgi:hypothetical protein